MIKKLWNDPVWSKVIAAGILAIVAVIGKHFDWWSTPVTATRTAIRLVVAFLVATSPIQHWLIGLVGVLVLIVLAIIVSAAVAAHTTVHTAGEPGIATIEQPWQSYITDIFYAVRWRWNYGASAEVENLACFCPRCDYQLTIYDISRIPIMDVITFHCDSCNQNIERVEKPFAYVKSAVVRSIQQKLRNGNWANVVA